MNARLILLLAGLLAGLPAGAMAQEGGRCEILSGEYMDVLERGSPRERVVLSGDTRIVCEGGIDLRADTAISHSVSGRREFIGSVVYTDSAKSLVADRVDYYAEEGLLHARGNVILTDRPSGSVIEGSDLEYRRESPTWPQSIAVITGRPHATLHRQERASDRRQSSPTPRSNVDDPRAIDRVDGIGGEGAADTATVQDSVADPDVPIEIDADRMELVGEHLFRAFGRVELEHGETRGFGDAVEYDELDDRIVLTGEARVEDESFTLQAERIEALLQGEELREVLAEQDGVLLAEELRVEAPGLRVLFEDGEARRMIATRSMPTLGDSASAATLPQPRVIATEFWLTADSIDAVSPGQRLREVYAVGLAYGEQLTGPESAGLPEGVTHDWLSGDTIVAYFVDLPVGETPEDEAAEDEATELRTVLESLVSIGPEGRARSVYRMQEEGQADGELSINYMVANRITLRFRDGEVTNVEAEGPLQGLHLQPSPRDTAETEEAVGTDPVISDPVGT